jgi:hypothetical protein
MSTIEVLEPQALPVNTSVALRIIQTTPAIVEFNYAEIEANLDAVLIKYQGLIFTESAATDCKKTIAELRKGQKSLDAFRISTKKQLTESVTAFENQCKVLHSKFETVISPLTTQNDQFELDRKEKKRVEIQGIIDALVSENTLSAAYALQLKILDEYYNKGKTIKAIKAELSSTAKNAKLQQDKDEQDSQLITAKVELANAQQQLANPLMLDHYLRLLAYKSVTEIDLLITSDAIEIKARETNAVIAKAAEIQKAEEVSETNRFTTPGRIVGPPTISLQATTFQSYTDRVTVPSKPLTTAVYEITGTEEQLSTIEAYLDANNYTWIDRE